MRTVACRALSALFGLILGLLPLGAAAQQFPSVPPNTAIGRIGNGVAGPAQSIPFATLATQLNVPFVQSCASHTWFSSYNSSGVLGCTQPSFSDLLNSLACSQTPALTGDITSAAGSCGTTISSNAVTNAKAAQMAAYTLKGNPTGSTANASDFTIPSLPQKATLSTNDYVMIADSAASNALKYALISAVSAAGGVTSLNSLSGPINLAVSRQIFTSSGTYTPSTGLLFAMIECVGGGGGGGGVAGSVSFFASGGGGGAGGYARVLANAATIGPSQTVTIGAAGGAGSSGANAGSAGGSTSVGAICNVNGGSGGGGGSSGSIGVGGAGGTVVAGDLATPGGVGSAGPYSSTTGIVFGGGSGGDTALGFGGRTSTCSSGATAAGAVGSLYGGGGGGGCANNVASNQIGGAGAKGVVYITEYTLH